jgi:hypothetical protein
MAKRRVEGRFFGLRINCEHVPLLPASIVRSFLDKPSGTPHVLVWKNPWDDTVEEVASMVPVKPPACFSFVEAIEVSRLGHGPTDAHLFRRPLPRNGGNALFLECPNCRVLRRGLYGWAAGGPTTRSVFRSGWQCHKCAGLRYASEGGALLVRSRGVLGKMLGVARANRPQPWLPLVLPLTGRSTQLLESADISELLGIL